MIGLIGKKLGMMRVFLNDGTAIPVTAIKVEPNYVVYIKSSETDGYNAIQVGSIPLKQSRFKKPIVGHFKKANLTPLKYLKEFRVDDVSSFELGQELDVDIFSPGELVDIVGRSKGRGFTGTMKRWDFGGFPKSHGHRYHRAVGSVGNRTDPGRVWKSKRMAGRHGNETIRVQALLVVDVLKDKGIILVKGSVPGHKDGIVYIEKSHIAFRKKAQRKQERLSFIPSNLLRQEV
jgi:large subunit ribosomal protein L3